MCLNGSIELRILLTEVHTQSLTSADRSRVFGIHSRTLTSEQRLAWAKSNLSQDFLVGFMQVFIITRYINAVVVR